MSELLLINPRRRKKARKGKSRRRTARRARRALPALFGAAAAPKRRRRRKLRSFKVRARRNPIVPRGLVESQLKPAAIGAAGALANDVLIGYLVGKLPASLKTGAMLNVTKAATAVGLGMIAEKAVGRVMARQAAIGALTCVMHDIGREGLKKAMPTVQLGEQLSEVVGWDDVSLYTQALGEQLNGGAYSSDALTYSRLNGLSGGVLPGQLDPLTGYPAEY